ncbi:reverse transcriptase domain-containing protein [Tanacetum coccineum]
MAEEDEEKTAFYTEHGTFCYEKMPFGLRNAGATYQRLVDKAFSSQLGRNIKIYVDDMAIKSRNVGSLIADIEETFHTLRRINMKLNLKNHRDKEDNTVDLADALDNSELVEARNFYTICVLTNQPIRQVLLKSENSGRLAKWAIELDLDEEEITYALHFKFLPSNNEAEYETLIAGLELTIKMEVRYL